MKVKLLVAAISIAFIGGCAQAPQKISPEDKNYGLVGVGKYAAYPKLVDYAYIKPHVTPPIDRSKNAFVIDSRPAQAAYDIGHLPGAVGIPDDSFEKFVSKLPADKNKEIIFYSQGPDSELAHNSAFKAEKLGYKNVKVFQGGYAEWESKGQIASVSTAFINSDYMLIDSRPDKVFDKGYITGAINIPDNKFDAAKLPGDKNKQLIFYCGGLICDLSEKSAAKAKALGYKNVRVYVEGFPDWKTMNKPMVTPVPAEKPAPAAAAAPAQTSSSGFKVETGKDKEVISTAFFERIVKDDPSKFTIIDVRKADTCKDGTWPTAQCIPYDQLEGKLASLPKDKPIVFTCATGAQSSMAFDLWLEKKTPGEAYILDAEIEVVNGKIKIKK